MLTGWMVVLIAVLGLLLWALATNALVKRAGEIAFTCGLLATCFGLIGHVFRLP
jgi:hypothetical protein